MTLTAEDLQAGARSIRIRFADRSLILDASGVAYDEASASLIVSDLHLEKGSRAAARGRLVPALDSLDTLRRLRVAIEDFAPRRVICLGDSFDDVKAGERMLAVDRATLDEICALARECIWIGGNHDPHLPDFCTGRHFEAFELGSVVLRHEPRSTGLAAQIVGHLHPRARISAGGYRFSGPCFCVSADLLIMPAFGAYTSGISCSHPAISSLCRTPPKTYMLHGGKLWRVD